MQRSSLGEVSCSIARTVQIVGEWWTPLILRDLFAGLTRFEDLWHEPCGRPARAEVVCSHCGKELASENVISVAGPGGRIGPGTRLIGPVLAQRAADLRRSRSRSKGARRGRRAR